MTAGGAERLPDLVSVEVGGRVLFMSVREAVDLMHSLRACLHEASARLASEHEAQRRSRCLAMPGCVVVPDEEIPF